MHFGNAFDSGKPAAGHDKREQALTFLGINRDGGFFEDMNNLMS